MIYVCTESFKLESLIDSSVFISCSDGTGISFCERHEFIIAVSCRGTR